MTPEIGKLLIYLGVFLIIIGSLAYFFPSIMQHIGNLPGDIHKEGENYSIRIPLMTMLIISIVLSVLFNLFKN